jgi:hypothetical protein
MSAAVRILSSVVAAGLMAAAMWLHDFLPHTEDTMLNPISGHGRIGAVVANRVFSVRVDRVDVAAALVKHDITRTITMPSLGVFVIVQLRIKSNLKPYTPGHVRLATRGGLSYAESGRTEIIGNYATYQPMVWGPASYVFEIPKNRLAGARLMLGESALLDQLSAEADVDLGIDDAKAARLLARAPRDYVLKTP